MKHQKIQTFFTKKEDGNMRFSSENRMRFFDKHDLSHQSMIFMEQVHGSDISIVDENYVTQKCDGLISKRKDVALCVLVADCLPILFFDPIQEVIAVVHAGREGTFHNISRKMIRAFTEYFHSSPKDILVEIGPGINICCYEVCAESNENCDYVRKKFGKEFIEGKNIDIRGINEKQLIESGVLKENIFHRNVCTLCEGEDYFSFRGENETERFMGIISFR